MIWCKDTRLAVHAAYIPFKALVLPYDKNPTLEKGQLDVIINVCAVFYEYDTTDYEGRTPSQRNLIVELRERADTKTGHFSKSMTFEHQMTK